MLRPGPVGDVTPPSDDDEIDDGPLTMTLTLDDLGPIDE